MEDYEPIALYIVKDLETLRTLADPLRTQIYEILTQAPANARQIGERLGIAPSRLYYHINTMEKLGLIRLVETRMVANMVEKFYRAIAYQIDIDPELLSFKTEEGRQTVFSLLTTNLDATREDLVRSIQARLIDLDQTGDENKKPRSLMVARNTAFIPDPYAEEFLGRLKELIDEFSARDTPYEEGKPGYQNFSLLVAFYPSFYFKDENQK